LLSLLACGCASVEAASPLPAPPSGPDESVWDSVQPEPVPDPVVVAMKEPRTCREALVRDGIQFVDAAPAGAIVDAIKLDPVIHGITFRHHDSTARRLWVDCRFAQRLVVATDLLRAREVREVIHVGTYEPKCVGGGTPETHFGS
jgi:hypothetical protein